MDIDVLFILFTIINVMALLCSAYFFYKIEVIKSGLIRTVFAGVFCSYFVSFMYLEKYIFSHEIADSLDNIIFIFSTVSIQMLFFVLWFMYRFINQFTLIEKINIEHRRRLYNKKDIYQKLIDKKIALKIPFSITKIKVVNYRKLIDVSSYKVFKKILSYSVLMIKRELKNKHIDLYYEDNEIVIISYSTDKILIEKVANKIHKRLISPILMGDRNFILQPVIGCAVYTDEIKSSEEMLKRVDIACYKAKKLGLVFGFYSYQYAKSINEELRILDKLVYAIPNSEFELYYQPIVNSIDKTIHGYEALIRWPQKDGTMIPPDQFILVAEKNNFIKGITEWVVRQVARDIQRFKMENIHHQVHINISTLDLHDNDLYIQLSDLLINKTIEPSDVVLEVTESALMSDIDAAYLMLSKFSELGFYISIDDFGTGFSSLSLLRVLTFNQIKIDQSFIRNMSIGNSDYAIVASTIYLAHSLGCNVVAEGVEDQSLFNELRELGCDYIQGYFIHKPQDLTTMIHWSLKQMEKEKLSSIA